MLDLRVYTCIYINIYMCIYTYVNTTLHGFKNGSLVSKESNKCNCCGFLNGFVVVVFLCFGS